MTTQPYKLPPAGQFYCPSCERMYPSGETCPDDGTRLVKIKAVVDPLLGRVLDGRYTIIEKLGQGGMGAVYRGSQHSVGREVAIKVVNAHLVSDPDAIRRFLREAKIASRLAHPNAVAVLDFGQSDDGLFYLVMELVTGRTLDQVIKAEKTFRPERVVRIGMQVCDALEGAHALQIVHRDLKPANIMLLAQSRDLVKVLDFGLAKSVATDQAVTTMTNAGALLGTPAFMPPELALGEPCDGRADLYALGCILYLLGSGQLPFTYESPHELVAAHGHEPAPRMTGVPQPLADVIDRLLLKDPARRFQTAAETREALEASLAGRLMTPTPFAVDTAPSLGPFPRDTPIPRSSEPRLRGRSLAEADTIAAQAAPSADTISENPVRRRWVIPILVAFAIAGAGLGALVAMRGDDDTTQTPAATTDEGSAEAKPAADVAKPDDVKPATATDVATPVAKPDDSGSGSAKTVETTTKTPTTDIQTTKTTTPTSKTPRVTKGTTSTKGQSTKGTKGTTTKGTTTPGKGSGTPPPPF